MGCICIIVHMRDSLRDVEGENQDGVSSSWIWNVGGPPPPLLMLLSTSTLSDVNARAALYW